MSMAGSSSASANAAPAGGQAAYSGSKRAVSGPSMVRDTLRNSGEGEYILPAVPARQRPRLVGAHDQHQLGVRAAPAAVRAGCRWCGWGLSRSIARVDHHAGMSPNASCSHREAVLGRRSSRALCRGLPGRKDVERREGSVARAPPARRRDVARVCGGSKGAAEHADARGAILPAASRQPTRGARWEPL